MKYAFAGRAVDGGYRYTAKHRGVKFTVALPTGRRPPTPAMVRATIRSVAQQMDEQRVVDDLHRGVGVVADAIIEQALSTAPHSTANAIKRAVEDYRKQTAALARVPRSLPTGMPMHCAQCGSHTWGDAGLEYRLPLGYGLHTPDCTFARRVLPRHQAALEQAGYAAFWPPKARGAELEQALCDDVHLRERLAGYSNTVDAPVADTVKYEDVVHMMERLREHPQLDAKTVFVDELTPVQRNLFEHIRAADQAVRDSQHQCAASGATTIG